MVGAYENMNVTAKEKGKVLVKRLDNVYVFAPEETKADDEGEALNLKNKIVFGHVGRFNIQKNHQFLLDVFKQIHNKLPNSVLLLIGEGELFEQVKNQVLNYGLNDCVLFLGSKPNVNEYLMAMDILIFPSF